MHRLHHLVLHQKIEERCQMRKTLSRMPFWSVDTNMYAQASRQETEGFQKVSSTFDSRAWGWPVASGHALAQVGASNHLPAHHSGKAGKRGRAGRRGACCSCMVNATVPGMQWWLFSDQMLMQDGPPQETQELTLYPHDPLCKDLWDGGAVTTAPCKKRGDVMWLHHPSMN